jgi:hypothetical protein
VRDFGLGFDFYQQSLEEIQSITAEELLETGIKYFDPNQMVQLVVGRNE